MFIIYYHSMYNIESNLPRFMKYSSRYIVVEAHNILTNVPRHYLYYTNILIKREKVEKWWKTKKGEKTRKINLEGDSVK